MLKSFEDTYYPEKIRGSGKVVYVKRNFEMIDHSRFCIVYYNGNSTTSKSGTRIAVDYAVKKERIVFSVTE
ncbi:MAG: hypothetical protein E7578_06335 [Ruminococcaceae bacterium]|nr:hypothetical protein [Oscillospiraceae bacterium]